MIFLENMKDKYYKEFWLLLILGTIFIITRVQNLTSIPVFGDEAIYLRWSQIIKSVETLRFIPVSDGKQPLFMWITVVFFKFITDPLLAGRLLSVFSGLLNLFAIYITARIFFNKRAGFIAALLYLVSPFSFFFDRMSLPDNLLSTLGTISLLFSLLLGKYPRLDVSLILGMVLGTAMLTKSPAIYFIFLSFAGFLIINPKNIKKIYFPIISIVISTIIYNILRLGPQFSQIAIRNRDYVWGVSDILAHPLDPFLPHLRDILSIYNQYLSTPLIIIALLSLFYYRKKLTTLSLTVTLWWLLPLLANMAIAKVFTLRYVLFTLPPLLILIGIGLDQLKISNQRLYIIIAILSLPGIFFNIKLSTNPFGTKLYATESGYLSSWTSGWGIKEVSKLLIERSKVANVIVGSEGYFGTLPDGLQMYTNQVPQLTVFGVGIDINQIPEKLIDARNHGDEVYLLFNRSRLKLPPDALSKTTIVSTYPKPDDDELLLLRLN